MRYSRYLPHDAAMDIATRARTPRRVAAAKRAIQKQLDAVPLFPEMVKHKTPEERLDAMDVHCAAWREDMRQFRADTWRKARREIVQLPPIRQAGVRRYWQVARMPADPTYLLGLIRDAKKPTGCFWKRMRELRQLQLVGQGRLPRDLFWKTKPKK